MAKVKREILERFLTKKMTRRKKSVKSDAVEAIGTGNRDAAAVLLEGIQAFFAGKDLIDVADLMKKVVTPADLSSFWRTACCESAVMREIGFRGTIESLKRVIICKQEFSK